jgi:two-component system, LuxR family, sensor kinase FixL
MPPRGKGTAPTSRRATRRRKPNLADRSPALLADVDFRGRIVEVNQAWARLLGAAPDELEGRAWRLLVHPDDRPAVVTCLRAASAWRRGERSSFLHELEARCATRRGEWRWLLWRTEAAPDDACLHVAAMDIGHHRAAEIAAEESARNLAYVVDSAPIVLFAADQRGVITQFAGKMGNSEPTFHPRHWIGQNGFEVFRGYPQIISNWRRTLAGEEFIDIIEWTDQEWETRYMPLRDAKNDVTGLVGVAWNITPRRQAEHRLATLKEHLNHVSRVAAMGGLLAAIAHEVNQPLGAIVNYAQGGLLRLDRALADPSRDAQGSLRELRDVLGAMRSQAERAAQIIFRLRALVERGQVKRMSHAASEIIDEVRLLLEAAVKRHRAKLVVNFPRRVPGVACDRVQVQQVILNLVQNAVEAMEEAKRRREVTLEVRRGRRGYVEFSVGDRGPGLDAEIADRACEPFVSTKPGGVGMGLAISRDIVEAHGGRLALRPRQGGGILAVFDLPEVRA